MSDWTSFKGGIWRENVLQSETEDVIGQFRERNVVWIWAAVSLGEALRDIPKNGCGGD